MSELNKTAAGQPSEEDRIAKKAMKKATKLVKRYAEKHKASVSRAVHHLSMAKAAHAKGMEKLRKAASSVVEAHKLGKAADSNELAGNLNAAHDHFNTAANEMDDTEALLGNAMSAWGHSTNVDPNTEVGGEVNIPSINQMTEGDVPWYDSAAPYGEKMLKKIIKKIEKKMTKKAANGGGLSQEQVDQLVKASVEKAVSENKVEMLEKQVQILSRQPAGAPKVKIFDVPSSGAGGGDENVRKTAMLLEGVELQPSNESEFTKSAGRAIANMIKNGPKFGNSSFGKAPMWDPEFRGRGGTGARN